jgi:hypothetical protein
MEHRSDAPGPKGRIPSASNSQSRILPLLIATILLSSVSPLLSYAGGEGAAQESESAWEVKVIEPVVVSIVPHDPTAFTQGLEIHDGKFYESTGLYGESSVRIVNMTTGEIELQRDLPDQFFGEGLTIWNDSVIQLTCAKKSVSSTISTPSNSSGISATTVRAGAFVSPPLKVFGSQMVQANCTDSQMTSQRSRKRSKSE